MLPPASNAPPEDGLVASVAAAVPAVWSEGAAGAASCREAPPELVALSVTCTRCRPAETCAGAAASERPRPAGASTVTLPEAAEAESVSPVFASTALPEICQEMAPLPETS